MLFDLKEALQNKTSFLPVITSIEHPALGDAFEVISFGMDLKLEIEENANALTRKIEDLNVKSLQLKSSLLYDAIFYGLCINSQPAYKENGTEFMDGLINFGFARDINVYKEVGEEILELNNMLEFYHSLDVEEVLTEASEVLADVDIEEPLPEGALDCE